MSFKRNLSLLFVFFSVIIYAQVKIQGKVLDAETGKPISYADVRLPELKIVATTNSDGSFYIESSNNTNKLSISKSGYQVYDYEIIERIDFNFLAELEVKKEDDSDILDDSGEGIALQVATISGKKKPRLKKKENPAYAILREVWARKKSNGLKMVPQYSYNEYEKLQFDLSNIDSAFMKKKIFRGFEFVFDKVDTSSINGKTYLPAFLNESIYKVEGINTPQTQERKVLEANKTSGFENNEVVASTVKNLFKDINIYDNRLNFLDIKFVSPIATDGFSVYDYELKDTVDIDGIETYRIKYFPRREGELTFKGDMYISKNSYAVKSIDLETTKAMNVNFIRNIYMALDFDVANDSVFYPKKEYAMLDMSILSKKEGSKGLFAHKTVNYYNYDFETRQPDTYYSRRIDPAKTALNEKTSEYWAENRPEVLTKDQEGIYETLDQLNQVPKFNRIVKGIEVLGSGYWNVGVIDIGNLYSSFGFNNIEGLRLRAGARTYFSQNDMWRAQGFMAYGFRDDKFKYGADFRYMFSKYNRFQVGIGTKRDVEQLAAQLTASDGIMTRSFASSSIINQGDNYFLSSNNLTNIYTSVEPWKNVTFRLDGNYQRVKPASSEYFSIAYEKDGVIQQNLTNSSLSVSVIARPGAKYSQYGIDRIEMSSLAPTLMLRYTKGLKGVIDSDFEYDKIQFLYTQPILVGSFGKSLVTVEAGKTFQGVPLSLLSAIPGNESYGQVYGTFSQLDYYEFVTDEYVTLNYEHHFNGWILNKIPLIKKLKLREVGFLRAAYGDISEKTKNINRSSIEYFAPNQQIYYEYGFGIENIGWGNIRPIRIDFNWRGNYNNLPDVRKFGVTLGLQWDF
ncbi:DUF5686 family protein [Faecalibacter rhinopitheci]|uniref:Carboxypeptidase-like regulatory domain-containing protein n=1 Tax=Faecalibacter rhinopitheci TaxID=2779678 RepID=A0A8J7KD55_9FLAO|nr:DUF5686 family protein [Faecalibacter rhinopitheci]MBF0596941.1 carboxypeptidase-like regulatory domain-containing protein [Faecalibacter rhinopitheci]